MTKIVDNLTELVGSTPLLRLNRYAEGKNLRAAILAKLEYFNPLGSVKDRIALAMVEDAEEKGLLSPGCTIVEPTSGNTGVGLAFVAAAKGYPIVLVMPDTMSVERRRLLRALNADLVLTPGTLGMRGAIRKAEEIAARIGTAFIPQQFENPVNPEIHRRTTAEEILADTDGKISAIVAGVGTGGTLTGVGEVLKQKAPGVRVIAAEPYDSSVLSGEPPGPHAIQGIGAGFVPKVFRMEIVDEIFRVKNNEAIETSREVARREGLLVGISSGAALFAATKIAMRGEFAGGNVVVILPDTGERYLSTALYAEIDGGLAAERR